MRKAPVVIVLMASLVLAEQLNLTQLWSYKAGSGIEGLAFSDNGNLGAASWDNCAYIFDPNGNLLNKVCGNNGMTDASYSDGRFGFINEGGYAYITDENGNLIKKIHVGDDYDQAITMTPNGFVACYHRCAFFNFNGKKLWDVSVGGVNNGPSYYRGYWYIAPSFLGMTLILEDGKIIKGILMKGIGRISRVEYAWDTAVCGKYLAVSASSHLYLYNITDPENPREIWNRGWFSGAWQVAFSPDCRYLAVAEWDGKKFKIYDINGDLVLEKGYGTYVTSVAWWKDRIAVGLYDGRIYVYKVEGYSPQVPQTTLSLIGAIGLLSCIMICGSLCIIWRGKCTLIKRRLIT